MMGFPEGRLKELLIACARAVEEGKEDRAGIDAMFAELRRMVSKSGDPFEKLGAYMLEALVARMDSTGHLIYEDLKAEEAARPRDLPSHMMYFYEACPYIKFGYMSANSAIAEATREEARIHIIDFSIRDGTQWIHFLNALGAKPGGAPSVRITGISDIVSARLRDSNLEMIRRRLSHFAALNYVPFEFHAVAVSCDEVEEGHLAVISPPPGGVQEEALVVNFNLELHHIRNRDWILRLIKFLSPRVVTLAEQECSTNSANLSHRFVETLDYYAAIFESIDPMLPRNNESRIDMEKHVLAREIVNVVACEGTDRVERHELFVQWKARLLMAGFTPYPVSSVVNNSIRTLLQCYGDYYGFEERDGVMYLAWKDRPMVVTSAWR